MVLGIFVQPATNELSSLRIELLMPKLLNLIPKDSFIPEWIQCWPFSEAPESYQILTAISAMGAVVGRNAWFKYGDKNVIPPLSVMLLGPPGIGKTTIIDSVHYHLIDSVEEGIRPHELPPCTKEELFFQMSHRPKAVMFASELAAYFTTEKYKDGVIPTVTELLDYPPHKENGTRKDGTTRIDKPTLTVFAGSTIPWFQERIPKSANEGGFLPRFIIVHENEKGRITDKSDTDETKEFQTSRLLQEVQRKFNDFSHVKGRFFFDRHHGASDAFHPWKNTYKPPENVRYTFASRREEFVIRLALSIAISCGSVVIDETHMKPAIALYEYAMETLAPVIVPLTPVGKAQMKIIELAGRDGLTIQEICRSLRNAYSVREVRQLVEGLEFSGSLVKRDERFYAAK
jgi:hypothetical protein